jgi:MoxR-like ATPase
VGLPSRDEEERLLARYRGRHVPPRVEPVADREALETARRAVEDVAVAAAARSYLLDLVAATRADARLRLGASPRAALALQAASQARAALAGRGYVIPDDVKAVAAPVLAHRLVVDPGAALRGMDGDRVVADLLATVAVPLEG